MSFDNEQNLGQVGELDSKPTIMGLEIRGIGRERWPINFAAGLICSVAVTASSSAIAEMLLNQEDFTIIHSQAFIPCLIPLVVLSGAVGMWGANDIQENNVFPGPK